MGMSGFYSLAAPYDKLISPSAKYRCEAVKSLAAAIAEGQDPLKNVYKANGDTEDKFNQDLSANVSLVTISSDSGQLIIFPASAMLMVPLADGVVYRNTVLAIPLGAIAESDDLTTLQSDVRHMVLNEFGINAATYVTAIGSDVVVSRAQHVAILAARQAKITDGDSLIAKNNNLTNQLNAALNKIQELEAYISSTLPAH